MILFKVLFYVIVSWLFVFIGKADGTCTDGGDSILSAEDVICTHDRSFILFHSEKEDPNTFEECNQLCLENIDCKFFSYGSLDVKDKVLQGSCLGCSASAEFKHKEGFDTYEICDGDDTPVVLRASDASNEILPALTRETPSNDNKECLSSANMISFDNSSCNFNTLNPTEKEKGYMIFSNVGKIDDKPIDLLISVKGENKGITGNGFKCENGDRNCVSGSLGTINSKLGLDSTFLFQFVDGVTHDPVTVPAIHFSVFDIDAGNKAGEEYKISGFKEAVYDTSNSEASFSLSESKDSLLLTAIATKIGYGCDNPRDANDLGVIGKCHRNKGGNLVGNKVNRKKRSFAVLLTNKSEFHLNWNVPCKKKKNGRCRGTGGRNFLFGFTSGMDCEEQPPDPEPDQCTKPLSVCIAIDTSGSVCHPSALTCANFDMEKKFARDIIDQLNQRTDAKFAIVNFSTEVIVESNVTTAENAKTAVDNMTYLGKGTNTGDGIATCRVELNRVPEGNSKMMVVVTDGKPTRPTNVETATDRAKTQARQARDLDDISILSVGVTEGVDVAFLNSISSADAFIPVGSFEKLETAVKAVATKLTKLNICGKCGEEGINICGKCGEEGINICGNCGEDGINNCFDGTKVCVNEGVCPTEPPAPEPPAPEPPVPVPPAPEPEPVSGFCRKPVGFRSGTASIQCPIGIRSAYYIDHTDCRGYCYCTGTKAPSQYTRTVSKTYWQPTDWLTGRYGPEGYGGSRGGLVQHTYEFKSSDSRPCIL